MARLIAGLLGGLVVVMAQPCRAGTDAVSVAVACFVDGVRQDVEAARVLSIVADEGVVAPVAVEEGGLRFKPTAGPAFVLLDCGGRRIIERDTGLLARGGVVLLAVWRDKSLLDGSWASSLSHRPGEKFADMEYGNALASARLYWSRLPKALKGVAHLVMVYAQIVGKREGMQIGTERTWLE